MRIGVEPHVGIWHLRAERANQRFSRYWGLIPASINQNPYAHCRRPIDMIFQG
jgi:hypothetical protein